MGEDKVIYKEESYKIVGCCFKVFNQLGAGHREKTYQTALAEVFKLKNIEFKEQFYLSVKIGDKIIDKRFFDFLVLGRIVLELKVGDHFHKRDIEQLHSYLRSSSLKLGILVNFASTGANFRRVLNAY